MRFTGSFQTTVTHGRSRSYSSSTVVSGVRWGASGPATGPTLGRAVRGGPHPLPIMPGGGRAPALLTDRYEPPMVAAALAEGPADRSCVFEVFARRLPHGRRYGVVAGTGRLLDALPEFRFDDDQLRALLASGTVDEDTAGWLRDYEFTGDVTGYPEGELYFPG